MTKKKILDKSSITQPLLTVVLILLIGVLVFVVRGGNKNTGDGNTVKQVTRLVSFEEAANNFLNNSYEVYTIGNLAYKSQSNPTGSVSPTPTSLISLNQKPTSTQAGNTAVVTENNFNDLFFYLEKGQVKRFDYKTYGFNGSIFFTPKGDLISLSSTSKSYNLYPRPADSEKDAINTFETTNALLQETFPLIPLIRDYKDKKFNPVQNPVGTNTYRGQWQHPTFTSNEVIDIIIQTDDLSGVFNTVRFPHKFLAPNYSEIKFDFRKQDFNQDLYKIPEDYKSIPTDPKYKVKE